MPLKDLSGKTVYDLERIDFKWLYCQHCKTGNKCAKQPLTINICMGLVDSGVWDKHFRNK